MKIEIISSIDKDTSESLEKAAKFYANYLLGKRITNNLYLKIERLATDEEFEGYCNPEESSKSPRKFTIGIKINDESNDPLLLLAHEMVHLKQYVYGEYSKDLYLDENENISIRIKWRGSSYKFRSHEDPYWDAPWEIEALGREQYLHSIYLESLEK